MYLGLALGFGGGSSGLAEYAVAPQIHGTPIEDATVGDVYPGFTVSASGGRPPYVFSVASGSLPAGLTLNASTGAVAGTPTNTDAHVGIILRVTDANGFYADLAPFTLTPVEGGGGGGELTWTDPDENPWTAPTDGEWTKPE